MTKYYRTILLLFLCLAFSGTTTAQMNRHFSDDMRAFLNEKVCNENTIKEHFTTFVGSRIPSLEFPEPENYDSWAESTRQRFIQDFYLKNVPQEWINHPLYVKDVDVIEYKEYSIKKIVYECLPGLKIPALLYVPKKRTGKAPMVLNVNGHFSKEGKALESKQIRCINLAKKGVIALSPEWMRMGELYCPENSHHNGYYLELLGKSGVSVFYLQLKKAVDLLCQLENGDPSRLAVTGLSGGGWQTITIGAMDTRITHIIPNAGYDGMLVRVLNSRDIGDFEQAPSDMMLFGDYTHLTALLAPRPALLIYNKFDDCCFRSYRARMSVYDPILPLYEKFGAAGNFQFYENVDPGTHNYGLDNRQQFYKFLNPDFGTGDKKWSTEINSENELLTIEKARVGVPENKTTLLSLAQDFLPDVPRKPLFSSSLDKWMPEALLGTAETIRLLPMSATKEERDNVVLKQNEKSKDFISLSQQVYNINQHEWQIPSVKITSEKSDSSKVVFIITDEGKVKALEFGNQWLESGYTVIAIDLFGFGEQKVPYSNESQGHMLVSTVGERSLGIAISQLNAIIRATGASETGVAANGITCSIIGVLAAALNEDANINFVEVYDIPISLKQLLAENDLFHKYPMLYCFGLLENYDVREYLAMAGSKTSVSVKSVWGDKNKLDENWKGVDEVFKTYGNEISMVH